MNPRKNLDLSLIITTYQSVEKLRMVLESVEWQSVLPKQIIVADDGSNSKTKALVSEYRDRLDCPVVHSWQPDTNFRLARSRNLAALKATGLWLLFLDGDCVMPSNFLAMQAHLSEDQCVVFGSRKLLSEGTTKQLVTSKFSAHEIHSLFTGRKFWRLDLGVFRKFPRRSWRQLRGFHIGISRESFIELGGFDETFVSWGLEDSEFAVRAQRAGKILKDGRYATSLLHLWHPESTIRESSNRQVFDDLCQGSRILPLKTIMTQGSTL